MEIVFNQVANKDYAGKIPHLLNYFVVRIRVLTVFSLSKTFQMFQAATSLGGVESLVEQRVQSDPSSDPCLLRLSIGVEDLEVSGCLLSSLDVGLTRKKGP